MKEQKFWIFITGILIGMLVGSLSTLGIAAGIFFFMLVILFIFVGEL